MKPRLAVLTCLAVVVAGGAQAQGFPDLGYMGTTIGAGGLQTSAMNNVISMSVGSRTAPRGGASNVTPPIRARGPNVTTYRANSQVSARLRKQFSDWMGEKTGAEGGRRVAAILERTDPVQNWAQLVASDGLRSGDTADALAGYWVLNWIMANGGDSSRSQVLAVRDQVRPTIASNPVYARLNEPQRQEFAEVLMLNFLMQHAAYSDAIRRGDRDTARRLGDAAVVRFRNEMGVDLRQLQLTDAGFMRR